MTDTFNNNNNSNDNNRKRKSDEGDKQVSNKKANVHSIKIGDVFQYTTRHRHGGLFVVTNLGKQFVSIQAIETKTVEAAEEEFNVNYSSYSRKAQAVLPIIADPNGLKSKFSYAKYNAKNKSAVIANRNTGYISYNLIEPDENGNYNCTFWSWNDNN
jgi:hypothetical protein